MSAATTPLKVGDRLPASASSTRPSPVSTTDFSSVFTLYGTREAPLFPVDQVERLLVTDIQMMICDFDPDEVTSVNKQRFLTEAGVERLLFARDYEAAISFKRWLRRVKNGMEPTDGTFALNSAEKRIQEAEREAREAKAALEKEVRVNQALKHRLRNQHEPGQLIYVVRNAADPQRSLFKIGRSKDLNRRECQYRTSMPDGVDTIHCVRTGNSAAIEKVIHYILDRFRYNDNREWFNGDAEMIARVMNSVVFLVEGLAKHPDKVVSRKVDDHVAQLIASLDDDREAAEERPPAATLAVRDFIDKYVKSKKGAHVSWMHCYRTFLEWVGAEKRQGVPTRKKEVQRLFIEELGSLVNNRFDGVDVYGWRHLELHSEKPL